MVYLHPLASITTVSCALYISITCHTLDIIHCVSTFLPSSLSHLLFLPPSPSLPPSLPSSLLPSPSLFFSSQLSPLTHTQVRSKLSNPTNYHVTAMQKRQLHNYLSSQGVQLQSHSAPTHNTGPLTVRGDLTRLSMPQKDPLLSGAAGAMNTSPIKHSPLGSGGMFGSQPTSLNIKPPESPTMMMAEQTPEDVS